MVKVFLNFELDEDLYELRRNGEVVATHGRVFDLIAYLLRHRDRVIGKEELTRELWEATVTSDTAISQVVMLARKALCDEGKNQRVIKTVRGRGFRFIAEVRELRQPAARAEAHSPPMEAAIPPSPGPRAIDELIGREEELSRMQAALQALRSGRGGLLLVEGEPGIGKTTLADALARRAAAQHVDHGNHVDPIDDDEVDVHWGRAWEDGGASPFWPWIQVLRGLCERDGEETTRRFMGAGWPPLVELLPELGPAPRADLDGKHARFRLFDAMSRYLKNACQRTSGAAGARPRLLILDDLHAVDEASLQLLRFLAPDLPEMALLIVGTLRDLGVTPQPALSQLALSVGDGQRIRLAGLGGREVTALLARRMAQPPSERMARMLLERTAGNPLLLCELSRRIDPQRPESWFEPSALAAPGLPERVAQALRQHLEGLLPSTLQVLASAAALGREFRLPILAAVSGCSESELLERLATALARGLLRPSSNSPDELMFSHALVRDAIYAELTPTRRLELHRRIAEQLERSQPQQLYEIAHHFLLAAAAGCRPQAIEYARRAALRACDMRAYEVAAGLYDRASQLAESQNAGADEMHELLCAAGDAWYQAGQLEHATARFDRAAQRARSDGDGPRFANAVLYSAHALRGSLLHDRVRQQQVREALRVLPAADSCLRANLLAASAMGVRAETTLAQRDATTLAAVEMARRLGDEQTLLRTLTARHFDLWGVAPPRDMLAIADEMVELGRRIQHHEWLLDALLCRIQDYAELGDHVALFRDHEEYAALAGQFGSPWHGYMLLLFEATQVATSGDFVRAAQLSDRALRQGLRVRDPLCEAFHALRGLFSCLARGVRRASEDVQALLDGPPRCVPDDYHPFWALPAALRGRRAEASLLVERVIAQERNHLVLAPLRRPLLAIAGQASALLGDRKTAQHIYQLLLPSAGLFLQLQAGVYLGPVEYYLGTLAASVGDLEQATAHFREAYSGCRHLRLWAARCELSWAMALGPRNGRARELLRSAEDTASQFDLGDLREDVRTEFARRGSHHDGARAPAGE